MKIINYLLFCFTMIFSLSVQSQNEQNTEKETLQIYTIAAPKGDSIILRWAPATLEAWLKGNETGYNIIRYTVSRNGDLLNGSSRNASKVIVAQNLKPWTQDKFIATIEESEDDYLLLGAGTLFDEQFTINNTATSPLDIDKVEEDKLRRQQRFTFALFAADQSALAAKGMALGLIDKSVEKDAGYLYQVHYAEIPDKELYEYLPGEVVVPINESLNLPMPVSLAGNFADHKVTLEWDNEAVQQYYTTFFVERSEDGINFKQRNENPVTLIDYSGNQKFIYYADTLEENQKNYIYRIRGKTPFGEFGPYSDTIQGKGFPGPIPAIPTIYDVVEFPKGNIQLRWEFDTSYNNAISGFQFYRAPTSKGPFLPILDEPVPAADRIFVDTLPLGIAYYFISALDTNGYKLSSFPVLAQLVDLVPPAPPVNVEGELDPETGEVTLIWSANNEEDLAGYRVFFANNPTDHFAQVSSQVVRDTTFKYTVTMNTTSEEVYFRVIATDFRENFSPFSDICIVKRPDVHPPSPPLIRKVNALENRIVLTWAVSASRDIAFHQIERKIKGYPDWEVIETDSLKGENIREFSDKTAEFEKEYEYRILATDDDGLETPSRSIISKLIDRGVRDSIINFNVAFLESQEEEKKEHSLNWEYPEKWEIDDFVIYRGINSDKVKTYKVLSPRDVIQGAKDENTNQYSFVPENVKKETSYTYQLIARLNGGKTSPLTEVITIMTEN